MSVNSISSLTSTAASQVTGATHHHGKNPFEAVSSLLGMSTDDLASQVASGKSLDDIASAKGVSHTDLVSALKAGMPGRMKNSPDVDKIAEAIAAQQGMPTQGPGGTPPSGSPSIGPPLSSINGIGQSSGVLTGNVNSTQQDMLSSLSSLLGTDSNTLLSELQSGTSLSDLVKHKGIGSSTLANVLQNGLLVDTKA